MGDIQPGVDPSADPTETGSDMLDGSDVMGRLNDVERRLNAHAEREKPAGLTDPDPDGTERWEAGQVWGHMAEFVGYWSGELERVITTYDGEAVAFGRTKEDAGRITGIEMGLGAAIPDLMGRVRDSIAELRRLLAGLTSAEWNTVGRHPTRGELDAEAIVERFIVAHLEEHADQLDTLTAHD
ncbi:MAG TPA: DinB family protein [Candidatus Limnocylindrales bacterium]|nr:DinB family protein [Candidatus Limnocylindrales bacterium]